MDTNKDEEKVWKSMTVGFCNDCRGGHSLIYGLCKNCRMKGENV